MYCILVRSRRRRTRSQSPPTMSCHGTEGTSTVPSTAGTSARLPTAESPEEGHPKLHARADPIEHTSEVANLIEFLHGMIVPRRDAGTPAGVCGRETMPARTIAALPTLHACREANVGCATCLGHIATEHINSHNLRSYTHTHMNTSHVLPAYQRTRKQLICVRLYAPPMNEQTILYRRTPHDNILA